MKLQEILVDKFDITDIDLDYNYSDELDENGDNIRIDIEESDEIGYAQCPPAKIDEVIEGLLILKNKGADRVYISEHVDHHGYYFYGIKLDKYVPKRVSAWKVTKSFPGVTEGEVYIFDKNRSRYYKNGNRIEYVEFREFEKFPEFFERIEIEL
jgi:hypothetical protein